MPSAKKNAGKPAGKSRSSSSSSKEITYQVRDIRGYRIDNKVEKFFVLWLDYADEESTWEPWRSLSTLGGDLRAKMEALRERYKESVRHLGSLRGSLTAARDEALHAARRLAQFAVSPQLSSSSSSSSSSSGISLAVSAPKYSEASGELAEQAAAAPAAAARDEEQDRTSAAAAAAAAAAARKELLQLVGVSRIATRNLLLFAANLERCVSDHNLFFESPEKTLGLPQRQQHKRSSSSSSSISACTDTAEDLRNCPVIATQDWHAYPRFGTWGFDTRGRLLLRLAYLQVNFPPVDFSPASVRRALGLEARYMLNKKIFETLAEWQLTRLIGYECMLMPNAEFLRRLDGSRRMLQQWQFLRRRLVAAGLLLLFRDTVKNIVLIALRATREQLEEVLRDMALQQCSSNSKKAAAAKAASGNGAEKETANAAAAAACSVDQQQQQQQQQQGDFGCVQRKRSRLNSGTYTPTAAAAESVVDDDEMELLELESETEEETVFFCDVHVEFVWLNAREAAVTHAIEVVQHAEETARDFAQNTQAPNLHAMPNELETNK